MENILIESQAQRESFKDEAVQLRESGNLENSIQSFEKIIEWDLEHDNLRGAIDVYGHERITWTHFAERESDPTLKRNYYLKAQEASNNALQLVDEHFSDDKDLNAILSMHQADVIINIVKDDLSEDKESDLDQAVSLVSSAIENLGGSEAHKAWALNRLAQAQHLKGNAEEALDTIRKGQEVLEAGYKDEISSGADGLMKLKVWQSGLYLTQAKIYIDTDKSELAKILLQAAISVDDPTDTLRLRKEQAERLLNSLN